MLRWTRSYDIINGTRCGVAATMDKAEQTDQHTIRIATVDAVECRLSAH